MDLIIEITVDNFEEEVLKSDIPVLVDFMAPWCQPCHMMQPYIEEIARDYQGKLKVGKINLDEHRSLGKSYGIQYLPTFFLFIKGEIVGKVIGGRINKLEELVEKFLGPSPNNQKNKITNND